MDSAEEGRGAVVSETEVGYGGYKEGEERVLAATSNAREIRGASTAQRRETA